MSGPKKLFGVPRQVETDKTEYLANDGSVYVWQVTTMWVDVGDVDWEKHQYEAWRMKVGENYPSVISGFDIPREVLEARDPHAIPPDGALVDPESGPESEEDDFWEEGPTVYYADEPEEEPMGIDMEDDYEPEEIPPEDLSEIDDA